MSCLGAVRREALGRAPTPLRRLQSLAAQAAARRHLSDEQSVSRHESRISLAPEGKVKKETVP